MRFVYLALVSIILIISCGSGGCDFITGKSPEGKSETYATHADVTIYTDSDWEPLFSMPALTSLSVYIDRRYKRISNLSPLAELKNLTSLSLEYHGDELDLSVLEPLKNLKSLSLETSRATNIQAVSSLDNLSSLELIIPNERINQITCDAINSLSNLTALKIKCYYLSISRLTNLAKLVSLDLSYTLIADLAPIASFENLVELNLEDNNIIDITLLSSLTKLTSLNLQDNSIVDITPLSSLNNLASLNLQGNKIMDITPLKQLTNLTHLSISWNEIDDISPLTSLESLQFLSIGCNQINDITPLKSLSDLEEVLLDGNPLNAISISEVIPELLAQGVAVYWWKAAEYDWLLALLLTMELDEGEYHIYSPDMSFGIGGGWAATTSFGGGIEYLTESFREQGVEVGKLLEVLFQRNQVPERMQIPSSLEDGYLIDYDGHFMSYFENDPEMNGWERLREENPGAHAFVTISVPAYDPETGIVLVYIGWQGDWLMGEGRIYALKYDGTRLREIASVGLWIS